MKAGYIYQADLWCEDCGREICKRIAAEGHAPADAVDETSYDSDEYPKRVDVSGEADSPQHCGAHEDCLNAITLGDGTKVGEWLENDLTSEGVRYTQEQIREKPDNELCRLWADWYADDIGDICPHCGRPMLIDIDWTIGLRR